MDIWAISKNANILLCAYKEGHNVVHIMSKDTIKMLGLDTISMKLCVRGFLLSYISSYSLHSGGNGTIA